MANELIQQRKAWSVLIVSTLAFTVCFMVWMMFGVIGVPIKKMLNLNATEFGLLMAMPVLTGSLVRVPLGIWTDRYGGRIVMAVLMALTVPAIWLMSYATAYWHFLVIGLFVGLAGGSFSVGTPYVARWFPKNKQGMAMGVYGAGNSGSAVNKFVAPVILVAFGWAAVPQVYAAIMAGTVVLFWLFSHSDPAHLVPSQVSFMDQLKTLKDPRVLKYCQYYSIVFGGYVALALWMVQYYIGEYGLDIRVAALLAACFSLPGGVLRAVGGVLSDKYRATDLCDWPERVCVHLPDVHPGHCLGLWQGQCLQVHRQRLPRKHRCHQRHGGFGRRAGRFCAAHPVWRAGRSDRCAQQCLHVDVRRGLGLAHLDVLDRGAQNRLYGPSPSRHHATRPARLNPA
jgi:NNP family nitrate/nitrite transporter-like MFS transporter